MTISNARLQLEKFKITAKIQDYCQRVYNDAAIRIEARLKTRHLSIPASKCEVERNLVGALVYGVVLKVAETMFALPTIHVAANAIKLLVKTLVRLQTTIS